MCKGIEIIEMMCASAKIFIAYDTAFRMNDNDDEKVVVSSPLFTAMSADDRKTLEAIGWVADGETNWITFGEK